MSASIHACFNSALLHLSIVIAVTDVFMFVEGCEKTETMYAHDDASTHSDLSVTS